ncbi:MAG TPA: methyltransferase [Sphingomicrobium sp.]|nr:methyltransferase [Sphingomicrobium sp.]
MAVRQVGPRSWRSVAVRNGSTLACLFFVFAALVAALVDRSLPLAIYLLSFGHYALYWIAFAFGTIAFDVFKRDAIAMKTLAVTALAFVYLRAPLDPVSLAVIAGGILLNLRAAQVLGLDRTYYGHEVADLPARRITAFPYSLTSHPMILGNVAAFGGTLINAPFRAEWWPLAGLHVVLNIGLLAMELAGPRHRRAVRIGGGVVLGGALLGAVLVITRGSP